MTKKEARERKAAWLKGSIEGRVVREDNGVRFTLCTTREKAIERMRMLITLGIQANIVGQEESK